MDEMLTLVAKGIGALLDIWAHHANKPGWTPTPQDVADLLAQVDEATPENEKAAARERLRLTLRNSTGQPLTAS